jgi:hypothetical protein
MPLRVLYVTRMSEVLRRNVFHLTVEHNVFIISQLVTRTSLDLTRVRTSDGGSILPVWDGWMSLCQEKIQRNIDKVR